MPVSDFGAAVAREIGKIVELTGEDRETLEAWVNYLRHERDIRDVTVHSYLVALRMLAEWWGKPLSQLTKKDALRYKARLKQAGVNMLPRLQGPRSYLKFAAARADDELLWDPHWLPEAARGLRVRARRGNGNGQAVREMPVLTTDDVEELIKAASRTHYTDVGERNACLVALLYSTGFRAGEFISMRVRDLWVEDGQWKAHTPHSKTVPRTIPVLWGEEYAAIWEAHRADAEPDAPLWVNTSGQGLRQLQPVLERIVARAPQPIREKFKRARRCAHLFRHSRATHLAHEWKDPWQLRDYFGWTSLAMPNLYVHASKGRTKPPRAKPARTVTCECGYVMPAIYTFCPRCGAPARKEMEAKMGSAIDTVLSELERLRGEVEKLKQGRHA